MGRLTLRGTAEQPPPRPPDPATSRRARARRLSSWWPWLTPLALYFAARLVFAIVRSIMEGG